MGSAIGAAFFRAAAAPASWRFEYKPRVFPLVWRRLEELIEQGRLIASSEVLLELERKDDDLAKWAKAHEKMFLPVDEAVQVPVKEILRQHRRLVDTRRGRSGADPFVIAVAKVHGASVVTDESPRHTGQAEDS
jgi:hypothetical protein